MCKLNNCPQKLLSGRNRRLCLCWGGDRCGCDKLWTNVPEKLSTYFEWKNIKRTAKKKNLLILTLNIMHVDAPACTNTCMYTHVGPLKPMFDMKQNQETLTWSRRRALWLRQGKWWLQTPGRTGWVEMDGEEQKQRHLLLPQPPHCWSQASEIERGWRKMERGSYLLSTCCKGVLSRSKWHMWRSSGRRGHSYWLEKKTNTMQSSK